MSVKDVKQLLEFLAPFDASIRKTALQLREFVWAAYPDCNDLIYDGPAALAFGWTPSERTSEVFATIAIYNNDCVQFGFYNGSALDDPAAILEGKGAKYRFIRVRDRAELPEKYISALLEQAYSNSVRTAKGLETASRGLTEVRSVSPKKRRPKPPSATESDKLNKTTRRVRTNMKGFKTNIEKDTIKNKNFRKVLYTSKHSQLVLMSLRPKEEIGAETHPDNDQFIRFEGGRGRVEIDGNRYTVKDGDAVVIPAGAKHNVINTSAGEELKIYTIYSPPHHKDGIVRETKEEAEANEADFDGKTTERQKR